MHGPVSYLSVYHALDRTFLDKYTPLNDYSTKTDALLDFGVHKVIWIFTDARKVMVAEKGRNWITHGWESDVTVVGDLAMDLAHLVDQTNT